MFASNPAEIFGIGTPELLLILGVVVLLFGAKRIPQLSRSIGQSVKELRGASNDASSLRQDLNTSIGASARQPKPGNRQG